MICAELGIEDCDFTNGASYVAHWAEKLRGDKKEVFRAASNAQRIADCLLAFHPAYAHDQRPGDDDEETQEAEGSAVSGSAALPEAA